MEQGKSILYLLPTPIAEDTAAAVTPPMNIEVIRGTECFITENARTARRYVSSLKLGLHLESLHYWEMDKTTMSADVKLIFDELKGRNAIVMSEAGMPCLADPGHLAVREAMARGYLVKPLAGPSAIIMALVASGLGGQQFAFAGYLPVQKNDKIKAIRQLVAAARLGVTQIFMETPYRNAALWADLLATLPADMRLCLALDVMGAQEVIKTMTVQEWKKTAYEPPKSPAVFLIG